MIDKEKWEEEFQEEVRLLKEEHAMEDFVESMMRLLEKEQLNNCGSFDQLTTLMISCYIQQFGYDMEGALERFSDRFILKR